MNKSTGFPNRTNISTKLTNVLCVMKSSKMECMGVVKKNLLYCSSI